MFWLLYELPNEIEDNKNILFLNQIDKNKIEEIIANCNLNVSSYIKFLFSAKHSENILNYTLRDLFLFTICRYNISFNEFECYEIIERCIGFNPETLSSLYKIKLSNILMHFFEGSNFSFDLNNYNLIFLKKSNLPFFKNVVRLCKFLERKNALIINYIEYSSYYYNGEEIIKPYSLNKLHHTKEEDCTYYNNNWSDNLANDEDHEVKKNKGINSIAAILSFLKFSLSPKEIN